MGHGFELTSEYKDGIFYIRNTIDYTKIDFNKLKEIVPGFNPLDDKTVSYSVTKDSLIKGGMVEKKTKWRAAQFAALFCFSMNSWAYFGRIGFKKK